MKKILLIIITLSVWGVVGHLSWKRYMVTAKSGVRLFLKTNPESVRIFVNNAAEANGVYLKTPTVIILPGGKTKVKIIRDGYLSQSAMINGQIGEDARMDNVVLERNPDAVLRQIQIATTLPEGKALNFDLGQGFARGTLPAVIEELVTGHDYVLQLNDPSGSLFKKSYFCKLKVRAPASEEAQKKETAQNADKVTHLVTLNSNSGLPLVSGCQPMNK